MSNFYQILLLISDSCYYLFHHPNKLSMMKFHKVLLLEMAGWDGMDSGVEWDGMDVISTLLGIAAGLRVSNGEIGFCWFEENGSFQD